MSQATRNNTPLQVGETFGRLTVTGFTRDKGRPVATCDCSCGKKTLAAKSALRAGHKKSCGCAFVATQIKPRHGMTKSPAWRSWSAMIDRCRNPSANGYRNYGGRGISVCDSWLTFENFFADMGDRPKGLSLERRDTNGNYSPENCRWATMAEQSRNRRNNQVIEAGGKAACVSEMAENFGINPDTVRYRIKRGMPAEVALTRPAGSHRNVSRQRKFEIDGETLCVTDIAKKMGIPAGALFQRIYKGWSIEAAIKTPFRSAK